MIALDELDKKAAAAFPGHIVRKDLVRRFRGQFPVPTYVVEFMLGRYCASTEPDEIEEGLQMVQSNYPTEPCARERKSCSSLGRATEGLCALSTSSLHGWTRRLTAIS